MSEIHNNLLRVLDCLSESSINLRWSRPSGRTFFRVSDLNGNRLGRINTQLDVSTGSVVLSYTPDDRQYINVPEVQYIQVNLNTTDEGIILQLEKLDGRIVEAHGIELPFSATATGVLLDSVDYDDGEYVDILVSNNAGDIIDEGDEITFDSAGLSRYTVDSKETFTDDLDLLYLTRDEEGGITLEDGLEIYLV